MKLEVSCSVRLENPVLDDVSGTIDALISFLVDQGVYGRKFIEEFRLAATEATNNAVEHGCAGRPEPFVELNLSLHSDGIRLKVADPSDFTGWTGPASLPEDPFAEGGRGRYLMEKMTDRIEHLRRSTGHVLILHKAFEHPFWSYQPGQQEQILEAMTEEVSASYEMINALIGLGELLAAGGDMPVFLGVALERLCELTGADAVVTRFHADGELRVVDTHGEIPQALGTPIDEGSGAVESLVFRNGNEQTVTENQLLAPGDPLSGFQGSAFVGLIMFRNTRLGTLVLLKRSGSSFFSAAQLKIARVVGEYLGIVATLSELQSRREVEQRALSQLEIAADIQLSLMPQDFDVSPHLDIFGTCIPAQRSGGDYFDLIRLHDGSTLVIVADVMGKGLSAALFANMIRTSVRSQLECANEPGVLLSKINSIIGPDLLRHDMFVTVICAWISADATSIRQSSAGHPPALLMRAGKEIPFEASGVPIGVLEETSYESQTKSFETGDSLVMFTDGIIEAADADDELFGMTRLLAHLRSENADSAGAKVASILQNVDAFTGEAPVSDDRTLLLVTRKS